MALTGEDLVVCARAAFATDDVPLSAFGLDDTPEVRAAIASIREDVGSAKVDVPSEFPDAGNADFLYSKDGSAAALAASVYDDVDPVEQKVDATLLDQERFLAGVDDPLEEFKRIYIRDEHGRFANVHEGGGHSYVERLGSNRHGSGYLDASDHALIGHHLSPTTARLAYNEAYDRGRVAQDSPDVTRSLGERHSQMRTSMDALRKIGASRGVNPEAEVHAETVLDSAGYIDGVLGSKRRYRRTLLGDLARGAESGTIGRVGAVLGKDDYDALTAEEKREYVRDTHGRFASLNGAEHALLRSAMGDKPLRTAYNDAYDRGRASSEQPGIEQELTTRHAQMRQHIDRLASLDHTSIEAASIAGKAAGHAGFIDGATGRKRAHPQVLFGTRRSVDTELLAAIGKDEYDALSPEQKREYVRDNDGRFARVPGSHVAIGDAVRANGGATLDVMTGHQPTTGFIVAVQGHNKEIPEAEFFAHRAKAISAYVKANREHLAGTTKNPRMLGIWHDKKNHEIVFDVVEQHHDKAAAIAAGKARNQQAIWDVANAAEIDTGGTGDRAVKADEAGRPDPDPAEPGGDDGRGDRRLGGDGGGEDLGDPAEFLLTEEKADYDVLTAEEKREYVRDKDGQFARVPTHSGMRVGETVNDALAQSKLHPDPTRMDALPQPLRDAMVAEAAKMGASPKDLEANIQATLDRAIARTGNPPRGHDWFQQAHNELSVAGDHAGVSAKQIIGATAASSPQMAWAPNLAVAQYIAENRNAPVHTDALRQVVTRRTKVKGKDVKVTKTNYEFAQDEINGPTGKGRMMDGKVRTMPSLAELEGKTFADLDPYVASAIMKTHAQQGLGVFNGKDLGGQSLSVADDITGKPQRVNFTNNTSGGRALRIIRGEDPNLILNGHKVRSFYNNLSDPTASDGDVTVDSHAVSLALGRKISSASPEYIAFNSKPANATIGLKGSYPLWADAYRAVAARNGLRPSQVQSIAWIQWRHEHPDNARTTHRMD